MTQTQEHLCCLKDTFDLFISLAICLADLACECVWALACFNLLSYSRPLYHTFTLYSTHHVF